MEHPDLFDRPVARMPAIPAGIPSSPEVTRKTPHSCEEIVIIRWDRFRTEMIARVASEVFPSASVRAFRCAAEALHSLNECPATLGLIGLTLPDLDGLDLIPVLAEERLMARVLVISERRDEHTRRALRTLRIDGFFDCYAESGEMLAAVIRDVDGGRGYFSPSWRRTEAGETKAPLSCLLSTREMQVFAVLGDGSSNVEAAERLGLSSGTVRKHRENIMRKLGVQSIGALVIEAQRRGVVRVVGGRVLRPGFDAALLAQLRHPGFPVRLRNFS